MLAPACSVVTWHSGARPRLIEDGTMPLSSDPDRQSGAARELAKQRGSHPRATDAITRPLAEAYLAELTGEFPGASERVLRLQARRLAKLDRLAAYLGGQGRDTPPAPRRSVPGVGA